jgi:hypothetical protein
MEEVPTIRVILLAAACLLPIPCYAAAPPGLSGNDWLGYCNDKGVGKIICVSYAGAVADTMEVWKKAEPDTLLACISREVTGGQLTEVGQHYMTVHAENRHHGAAQLLMVAFTEAWPCQRAK